MATDTTTTREKGKVAPGPEGNQLLGALLNSSKEDVIASYVELWREYGDVVRLNMGPLAVQQFVLPEHVRHIMVRNAANYPKGMSHDKLRIALGNGLLTSGGPLWQRQRRLMQPTYTPRAVTRFADIMVDATEQMIKRWQVQTKSDDTLVVNAEMMRLTMSVISRSMFDLDISEDFAEAGEALVTILEFAAERSMSFIDPPLFLPTPMNRRFKRSIEALDTFLYAIIDERSEQPPGDDLLSLLMTARDEETGEVMTREQLRDEVLITFFAGHETTATLLTWTWYLLSKYPAVDEKLQDELHRVLAGRHSTVEDIPELAYTRMIIDEVLRLYSPVAIMARDPIEADVIGGYEVPAGSLVSITPFITHRHPEFWDNPEAFMPERFTPEEIEKRPRYAYYPFGAGQRICLGQHFALLEGVLVVAELAQRYQLQVVPGLQLMPEFMGTLRPDKDLLMTLHKREH
ncbi:MAG: cytochrome P450 [Chloroflexota bacterium]|nr:cytochrome P450 [Chloroflexota bacterium]